jgi:hypothetical protein
MAFVEVAHSRSEGEFLDTNVKVGMEKQETVLLGSKCRDCGEVLDPVAARVEVLPSSKVEGRDCPLRNRQVDFREELGTKCRMFIRYDSGLQYGNDLGKSPVGQKCLSRTKRCQNKYIATHARKTGSGVSLPKIPEVPK